MDTKPVILKTVTLISVVVLSACQSSQVLDKTDQTSGPLSQRFPNDSTIDLIGGYQSAELVKIDNKTQFVPSVQFEGEWAIRCPVALEAANAQLRWPKNARVQIKGQVQSQAPKGIVLREGCEISLTDNQNPPS